MHSKTGRMMLSCVVAACVLLGATLQSAWAEYQIASGMVTDLDTGLVWVRADDGVKRDWQSALAYCEALTFNEYTDWRLPDVNELLSLVDTGANSPAIDTTSFPTCKSVDGYWTSTPLIDSVGGVANAWYIFFEKGGVLNEAKSVEEYVRCVRSMP